MQPNYDNLYSKVKSDNNIFYTFTKKKRLVPFLLSTRKFWYFIQLFYLTEMFLLRKMKTVQMYTIYCSLTLHLYCIWNWSVYQLKGKKKRCTTRGNCFCFCCRRLAHKIPMDVRLILVCLLFLPPALAKGTLQKFFVV